MRDVTISRRSALAIALAALAIPAAGSARLAPLTASPATARKLAEQPVTLTDRGVIWQSTTLKSVPAGSPAWPFHAGFLAALDTPLRLIGQDGADLATQDPGTAFPVAEKTFVVATSTSLDAPYLAIELVGQDDSDSPFRRPFKAEPGQYTLSLWSLSVDAGSDADIAALLADNLPGAPVMLLVRAGGVAVSRADGSLTTQILQGNWDAVDADSSISVPGGVSTELLIALISGSSGAGGDNDLGTGGASATTTSNPSSIVETSFPGVFQINYRSSTLKAARLSWQLVTGTATQDPILADYGRGFIMALDGAITLTEEDGTFRRIGGGNAITVRNGDRFTAQSLTANAEPFIGIELIETDGTANPDEDTFEIQDGKFTFELWRGALQDSTIDAFGAFMQGSPFPALVYAQRGDVAVTSPESPTAQTIEASSSRTVLPGTTFALTGTPALLLVARLISM